MFTSGSILGCGEGWNLGARVLMCISPQVIRGNSVVMLEVYPFLRSILFIQDHSTNCFFPGSRAYRWLRQEAPATSLRVPFLRHTHPKRFRDTGKKQFYTWVVIFIFLTSMEFMDGRVVNCAYVILYSSRVRGGRRDGADWEGEKEERGRRKLDLRSWETTRALSKILLLFGRKTVQPCNASLYESRWSYVSLRRMRERQTSTRIWKWWYRKDTLYEGNRIESEKCSFFDFKVFLSYSSPLTRVMFE